MSQNSNEARCEKGQSISNPGAFAMHKRACEVCGRNGESDESPDGTPVDPDNVGASEVAHITANVGDRDLELTIEALDFNPKDEDTARTAAAKALIDAKGGGGGLYREVFGRCAAEGCEYGANGFESDYCIRSDHEPSDANEASDEPDESGEAPSDESRANYVAELVDVGVDPVKAEEAATARFGGDGQ